MLRKALWKDLNQGSHASLLNEAESRALAWRKGASRPVSALTEEAVDPRCVGGPAQIAAMLDAGGYVGRRQGPRFAAFYACMYYAR